MSEPQGTAEANPEFRGGPARALAQGYRPDIDGLRAVAVLAVMVFHFFPQAAKGGFAGVDIFFVISGYLITGIILAGLEDGSFTFGGFYARRIRRIFPALILILAFTLAAGWHILFPLDLKALGKHALAGAGFLANLAYWSEAGYFDAASELKPLLHLWSLGVEEQYYILWPLCLYLAKRAGLNPLLLIIAIFGASFTYNIHSSMTDQAAAFYSPFARFWELSAGGALAARQLSTRGSKTRASWSFASEVISAVGVGLVLYAVAFIGRSPMNPGLLTLIPVAGACMIIAAGHEGWINRNAFSAPALVYIGLISYPLYLWHWPLISFARHLYPGQPLSPWFLAALAAASLALASLTYHLLERPVRFSKASAKAAPFLAGAMAIVAGAAAAYMTAGAGERFVINQDSRILATYQPDNYLGARRDNCWIKMFDPVEKYSADCVDPDEGKAPLTLLWGDSHAARLFPGLRAYGAGRLRLAQFTRDSCPPILDFGKFDNQPWTSISDQCREGNTDIYARIKKLRPKTVILFAAWNMYFPAEGSDTALEKLDMTIKKLQDAGTEIIIVAGPPPTWSVPIRQTLLKMILRGQPDAIPPKIDAFLNQTSWPMDMLMKHRISQSPGVLYFSLMDAFCGDGGCIATVDGTVEGLVTWDYGHLSPKGAIYATSKMAAVADKYRLYNQ